VATLISIDSKRACARARARADRATVRGGEYDDGAPQPDAAAG